MESVAVFRFWVIYHFSDLKPNNLVSFFAQLALVVPFRNLGNSFIWQYDILEAVLMNRRSSYVKKLWIGKVRFVKICTNCKPFKKLLQVIVHWMFLSAVSEE